MIGLRPVFSTMVFLLLLTGGVYPLLTTALGASGGFPGKPMDR
ncbi:potassium-transporting ATPase subunit C [Salmonella bongori]|nr:potassium-transporting ATPase subunit C [Salmonella bongori]